MGLAVAEVGARGRERPARPTASPAAVDADARSRRPGGASGRAQLAHRHGHRRRRARSAEDGVGHGAGQGLEQPAGRPGDHRHGGVDGGRVVGGVGQVVARRRRRRCRGPGRGRPRRAGAGAAPRRGPRGPRRRAGPAPRCGRSTAPPRRRRSGRRRGRSAGAAELDGPGHHVAGPGGPWGGRSAARPRRWPAGPRAAGRPQQVAGHDAHDPVAELLLVHEEPLARRAATRRGSGTGRAGSRARRRSRRAGSATTPARPRRRRPGCAATAAATPPG